MPVRRHLAGRLAGLPCLLLAQSFAVQATPLALEVAARVQPSACSVRVEGGGRVDLGNVRAGDLALGDNLLARQTVPVEVTCAAPVAMALQFTDESPGGTAIKDHFLILAGKDDHVEPIGLFNINLIDGVRDGQSSALYRGAGALWTLSSRVWSNDPGRLMAFAPVSAALRHASFNMSIDPYLRRSSDFNAEDEISLSGRVAIEVIYQ